MIDKKSLELISLIEKLINGEVTAIEIHDIFWDKFWYDKEWHKNASEETSELIANDIFHAFECFDGEHAITEPNDVPHELTEGEFLQKCKEFLPKLKEAVKSS
tara:strand:+ start:49481 stop:49789 length:309 start_codon:yes stop_codon:yes gene_type:complete